MKIKPNSVLTSKTGLTVNIYDEGINIIKGDQVIFINNNDVTALIDLWTDIYA